MKTIRLLALALVLTLTLVSTTTAQPVKYIYSELIVTHQPGRLNQSQNLAINKDIIVVNFGDRTLSKLSEEKVNTLTKQIESYNSIIDCLNYMSEDGWEVVDRVSNAIVVGYMQHIILKKIKQQ